MNKIVCILYKLFFFNDTATTEIYTLSLHDALPISPRRRASRQDRRPDRGTCRRRVDRAYVGRRAGGDRRSELRGRAQQFPRRLDDGGKGLGRPRFGRGRPDRARAGADQGDHRADARGARDALAARQPHFVGASGDGRRAKQRGECAERAEPAAAHRLARGRLCRVPALAAAAGSVCARVQARRRCNRRGLGRRKPAPDSGIFFTRRNDPARCCRSDAPRGDHGRHAPRRPAAARGFPRHDRPGQSRGPRRPERQSRGEHRRYPQHRIGHDPGPGDPARFPESHMEMSYRLSAIGYLVFLSLLTACGMGDSARSDGPYDVILKNGWIVDGSGNPRFRGDVAIRGDRIAAVGFLDQATARDTIDVTGLVVAPGFIDMMGQSEFNVLIDNRVLSKITQGITTEVTGEGGSVAPLTDRLVLADSDAMKKWHYREDWRDLNGYFAQLERQGSSLNFATFVGATQVRLAVVGNENRAPTAAELARMVAIVDTLMEQGGLGVWTALEYAPASYSKTDELIALARAARRHGGIYASHMRNEGEHIDDALNELFRIAKEADIPAEVSHLKLSGRRAWGQMPRILARIDSVRAAGLDVMADQYPYIRAATSLDASIPTWAESGGMDSLLIRLRDPATRARLHREMLNPTGGEVFYSAAGGADGILITGTFQDSLRYMQGKTVAQIAAARHRDPIETVFDIVLAEKGHRTDAVYAIMDEPDVQAAMKQWWVAVNTDFGGVAPDGPFGTQSAHPRAYGSFPRILGHYSRDLKLFPLEFAVRKMTSLAAQRVGLADRGLVKPGMYADVTVFNPMTVIDRATFEQPHQTSVGIDYVFVNGQRVLNKGQLTNARPGRGLRGPGYRGTR